MISRKGTPRETRVCALETHVGPDGRAGSGWVGPGRPGGIGETISKVVRVLMRAFDEFMRDIKYAYL